MSPPVLDEDSSHDLSEATCRFLPFGRRTAKVAHKSNHTHTLPAVDVVGVAGPEDTAAEDAGCAVESRAAGTLSSGTSLPSGSLIIGESSYLPRGGFVG